MREKPETPTFDQVYETYADNVLNLVFRLTGNEETARDLTQDIFLKIYENLSTFEHRSNIYTWIYRIAVNHAYNYLKKDRRQRWLGLLDKTVQEILGENRIDPMFVSPVETPADKKLEEDERAAIVLRTIQTLPPKYRVPLTLYHYDNASYKDIARILGISMSAVEARIHRARKKLIKLLDPWLDQI